MPATARPTRRWRYVLVFASALGACSLKADVDDLGESIDRAADELPDPDEVDINVCGVKTLGELMRSSSPSEACREDVESLLPEPQSSFTSRVVVLGQTREKSGARTLYVAGADADGGALFTGTPSARVSVEVDGQVSLLAESEVRVDLPSAGDLLSIGVVNDYSSSMRDTDIADVSEIETDLFDFMPPIYEGEVVQFSDAVDVVQPYSRDEDALLAAVDLDSDYERGLTALYDGMGVALDNLVARERPLRVLLVSTDGAENASTMFSEAELLRTIDGEKVVVIMLGALFADVRALKTLAGERGVYFYARGYGRLKSAVRSLVESLTHMAAVHLPASASDATSATLEIEGESVTVPLE